MSKKTYIGVNNVSKEIQNMYIGVDGVAKKVSKMYVGVNGVAQLGYITTIMRQITSTSTITETAKHDREENKCQLMLEL